MVENSDSKTEKVEEKKDNKTEQNPATTQEKISALIFLFVVGYVIYSLVSCVNNGSSSSSDNKSVSKDSIETCNKVVDAFNAAFTSNKYFQADATILKLKAVKAEVDNQIGDKVSCDVFIKNEGDKIIREINGFLYYFDNNEVSDKLVVYITNVIRPNETIKHNVYLPVNISRAEIRNRAGDSIFNYNYTIDFNSNK